VVDIKVEYFVPLSHILQKKEETFRFDSPDSPTVDSVLTHIMEKYGTQTERFPLRLKEASQYVVLLNGNKVSGYEAELVDGDVLRIMVPLAGG